MGDFFGLIGQTEVMEDVVVNTYPFLNEEDAIALADAFMASKPKIDPVTAAIRRSEKYLVKNRQKRNVYK